MTINVRISLDAFDFAHPAEQQMQVYVEIPEVARVSWLLPADFYGVLKSEAWPHVVDSAQEYYVQQHTVSDSDSAAARQRVLEWLAVDENHDAMHDAWQRAEARKHPVARKLLEENERLRARVAELELQLGAAAEQRHLLEPQDTFLTAGVARLRAELDAPDRIVAYRDPNNPTVLLCREHGERWSGVVPVTSEDLPDGGICTFGRLGSLECARDVLISGGGR